MTTAFYGRFSTDLQNEKSPEDQLAACRRHFTGHPQVQTIEMAFIDRAMSGSITNRPEYQRLLGALRDRKVTVVVAEALDRITRRVGDAAAFKDALEAANAKCFTISEGEITTLHIGLLGTMNQLALEETARKVKRGVWAKVSAGKHAGPIPYGYESDGTKGGRKIKPAEAEVVCRVFKLALTGMSGIKIAKLFNAEGVPAPRGDRWRSSTICGDRRSGDGILNNEIYHGWLIYNRHRYKRDRQTGKRRGHLHPESEWLRVEAPQLRIIDEEIWNKVQALQQSRQRKAPLHTTRRPKRLLSGLITCATCGGLFTVVNRDRLACSNAKDGSCSERGRLPWSLVEQRVLTGVKQNLLSADIVAGAVKQCQQHMRAKTVEQDRRRRNAERDLQDARRRAKDIVELMIATKSTMLVAALENAEREIERLEGVLNESGEAVVVTIHPGAPEAYRRRIMNLEDVLDDDRRRDELASVIRPLVARVTVKSSAEAPNGWEIALHGQLASIMALSKKEPPGVSTEGPSLECTAFLGAGVGFEPTTFRL